MTGYPHIIRIQFFKLNSVLVCRFHLENRNSQEIDQFLAMVDASILPFLLNTSGCQWQQAKQGSPDVCFPKKKKLLSNTSCGTERFRRSDEIYNPSSGFQGLRQDHLHVGCAR